MTVVMLGLLITDSLAQAPVYADKLYPVDQGPTDPSFKAFREQLRSAIKRRDSKFILNSLHPDVVVSLGVCGNGVKCFREHWQLDQPNNSQLWNTLSNILALGGSFSSTAEGARYFCAPYVWNFPDTVDGKQWTDEAHLYFAVIGQNVNVRLRPSLNAPIVSSLSYDIVKLDQSTYNSSGNWFKIVAPTPGYISSQFIRSPLDYRACFNKVNGKWLMSTLVGGD